MALNLTDCMFEGPALPPPFVKFELERELTRHKLLPKTTGAEGKRLKKEWDFYRRKLRDLAASGGPLRVRNHVIEPLLGLMGYARIEDAPDVQTREDMESGGALLISEDGAAKLRVWSTPFNEDLYAPSKRGRAYRFSHLRIAQRVLLTAGERLGLLTNGVQLLLLVSDPARTDSTVTIPLDPDWKRSRDMPDSFRMLLALAGPAGAAALPDIIEKARLQQARVTKELRVQARQAVEGFVQEVIDHPANRDWFAAQEDRPALAKELWREGLVIVYRLLFCLKLESSDDPARSFSFASTALWRNTFSPSMALAPYARDVLHEGAETGTLLESGLRALFRMFEEGLQCTELVVKPMGGALFGPKSTPLLAELCWGERAVAYLLDRLLWTPRKRGAQTRERVHYGPLDVEDLGRVYEALLELEPGISSEPMCRLRRQKLEVVVPAAQGEKYKPKKAAAVSADSDEDDDDNGDDGEEDEAPRRGKKTKVEWIEAIPPNRFYLRVGLGRKATGSYYTPHSFVRFLVQETLGPLSSERSPKDDPNPVELLKLKVLDPAMGSGHFLVEACRYLGDKLYEACRLCDEKAAAAEKAAEKQKRKTGTVPSGRPASNDEAGRLTGLSPLSAEEEAAKWRQRVIDLPDPDDEMLRYLPSHAVEGAESGFSQKRAEALCRRLVAVHCLYGVDKNPLAVELAKLSLWLESHAEGMPLTFLDHRLVVGDSLTGPFWTKLLFRPGNPKQPVENLFTDGLNKKLADALRDALRFVGRLEASVGITVAEVREKETFKAKMDKALFPFRIAAAAWSGGVMLGPEHCDDTAYETLLESIGKTGELPERIESEKLRNMIALGLGLDSVPAEREVLTAAVQWPECVPALPYDFTFPEVFFPHGSPHGRHGFHVVLGNPPWDAVRPKAKEFFAAFDFDILAAPTKRERSEIEKRLQSNPGVKEAYETYQEDYARQHRIHDLLYEHQVVEVNGQKTGGDPDLAKLFLERNPTLLSLKGLCGVVMPSAFHANEGATGIRRLYLQKMALKSCYSFENRRKLFEIHASFKFALLVAAAEGPTKEFFCAFYLHDDEWLFGDRANRPVLSYTLDFVKKTSGDYLSFVELKTEKDLNIILSCYKNGDDFAEICGKLKIRFSRELHMTDDAWRLSPIAEVLATSEDPRDPEILERVLNCGYLLLHEGKTFWQYEDRWEDCPAYCVRISTLNDKFDWCEKAKYFRAAYRAVASSTNERTVVFSLVPPGAVFGNSAPVERTVPDVPRVSILAVISRVNSYSFDWTTRIRAGANVNQFILFSCPLPKGPTGFYGHSALRLTCNHAGYAPLWREQLGDEWREPKPAFTWPVLEGDDERWAVRAAIDAVVADAYGLNRDQYAHVLSTFSHKSYPKAPDLCLARFDELKSIGLDAFTKKHDPYHDIPLNQNLPQPVIDLPIPAPQDDANELLNHAERTRPKGKLS